MTDIHPTNLHYDRPIFPDHTFPKGLLIRDEACQACWFYAMLAFKNYMQYAGGHENKIITVNAYDNEFLPWNEIRFANIARSVAIIYGLESPDVFLRYADVVQREAARLHIELPEEVWRPLTVSFKD